MLGSADGAVSVSKGGLAVIEEGEDVWRAIGGPKDGRFLVVAAKPLEDYRAGEGRPPRTSGTVFTTERPGCAPQVQA